MVHINVTTQWVYEHFLTYLYLCIADADCIISEDEKNNIRKEVCRHMDEERCSSVYNVVYTEYRSHNDEEKQEFIKENAGRFLRTEAVRKKVIQHLEDMTCQCKEESEERVMFRFIRRVINGLK